MATESLGWATTRKGETMLQWGCRIHGHGKPTGEPLPRLAFSASNGAVTLMATESSVAASRMLGRMRLQWGRDSMATESLPSWFVPSPMSSFNGAVTLWPRKEVDGYQWRQETTGELDGAVTLWPRKASASAEAGLRTRSFNGAVTLWPRKDDRRVSRAAWSFASMGP